MTQISMPSRELAALHLHDRHISAARRKDEEGRRGERLRDDEAVVLRIADQHADVAQEAGCVLAGLEPPRLRQRYPSPDRNAERDRAEEQKNGAPAIGGLEDAAEERPDHRRDHHRADHDGDHRRRAIAVVEVADHGAADRKA